MAEIVGAGIEQLETFLADFASSIEPAERKKMGLKIAAHLQKARQKTIGANVDAEGRAFEPRKKPRARRKRDKVTQLKRSIKQRKMFLRARNTQYLRKEATTGEARVGYVGAMARIMTVHQEGLEDTVTRDPSSPVAKYAMRRVLGISEADNEAIMDIVLEQLAQA
jgi:phage virion morphogenesis protein